MNKCLLIFLSVIRLCIIQKCFDELCKCCIGKNRGEIKGYKLTIKLQLDLARAFNNLINEELNLINHSDAGLLISKLSLNFFRTKSSLLVVNSLFGIDPMPNRLGLMKSFFLTLVSVIFLSEQDQHKAEWMHLLWNLSKN